MKQTRARFYVYELSGICSAISKTRVSPIHDAMDFTIHELKGAQILDHERYAIGEHYTIAILRYVARKPFVEFDQVVIFVGIECKASDKALFIFMEEEKFLDLLERGVLWQLDDDGADGHGCRYPKPFT